MQITKPTKAEVTRELKDYIFITLGLISYALGWAAFLIPYQITTGGTTGIGAIIYYATGFPIQWSYFIINAVLMTFAIKILGPKFSIKTTFAIFGLTFFLWVFPVAGERFGRRPSPTAGRRTRLHGLPDRCGNVRCRTGYRVQLQRQHGRYGHHCSHHP